MKIGIVGAGTIGSAAAYAIASTGVASSLVIVDRERGSAAALTADLACAASFGGAVSVRAGDYADLEGASVVLVAIGVARTPGGPPRSLPGRNARTHEDALDAVSAVAPDAVVLVATDPVDIVTAVATTASGLDASAAIGSGTILDMPLCRDTLGRHLRVPPRSVHARVLRGRDDDAVLLWSSAGCGAARTETDTGQAVRTLIVGKGATWFGVGAGLTGIARTAALHRRGIMTVAWMTADDAEVETTESSIRSRPVHPRVHPLWPSPARRAGANAGNFLHPRLAGVER